MTVYLFRYGKEEFARRGNEIWDGALRRIDINESDTEPLVGMSLLYGYRMQLEAIEGGTVTVQALSSVS